MKHYRIRNTQIKIGNVFYDLEHSYEVPYRKNELYVKLLGEQDFSMPSNKFEQDLGYTLTADIDFEYNYYSKKYESLTMGLYGNSREWLLPSLNVWLLNQNDIANQKHFEAMYRSYDRAGNIIDPKQTLSDDFFELFPNAIDIVGMDILEESAKEGLAGFRTPEFINKQVAKIYLDKENKREMFPMFSKINMSGMKKSEFCNLVEEYGLDSDFINFLASNRTEENRSNYAAVFESTMGDDTTEISEFVYLYRNRDFVSFISDNSPQSIFDHNDNNSVGTTVCELFESFLAAQAFEQKIVELISNMPVGMLFPVAYRLEKYGNGSQPEVHYFFNYGDIETFKYFDTQISYGNTYTYKINVINGLMHKDGELLFLEEPYFSDRVLVLDSPPIAPDVELLTYRGIDNKVLILFNQMIGKKAEVPIYVNPSDFQSFYNQYESQKIFHGNPLIFESDDPADFEFFRLNRKPSEYSDFSNENYKLIRSNGAMSAAYEDTIVPNQAYYYMFRAQDNHGHVSNPSPIYEFILIKDGETLYPKIRIVSLAKPEPPAQKSRTFKKYAKIGLSLGQSQIDKAEIYKINDEIVGKNIVIGNSEDNILQSSSDPNQNFRKFKFRIRSKNTGKLIDINVTFKKSKVLKNK